MTTKILLSKQKVRELEQERDKIKEDLLDQAIEKKDYGHMHEGIITDVNLRHKRKRLSELNLILTKVQVLPDKVESDKAVLGSWLEVEGEEGKIEKYRLVHPLEADPNKSLLSIESPFGKKLEGKKINAKVGFKKKTFKIVHIK